MDTGTGHTQPSVLLVGLCMLESPCLSQLLRRELFPGALCRARLQSHLSCCLLCYPQAHGRPGGGIRQPSTTQASLLSSAAIKVAGKDVLQEDEPGAHGMLGTGGINLRTEPCFRLPLVSSEDTAQCGSGYSEPGVSLESKSL